MTDFAVFEDIDASKDKDKTKFACQTEEIALGDAETQTDEEAIPKENPKDDEGFESGYWNLVIKNRKAEIARIRKHNDEMEEEITRKSTEFLEKSEKYDRFYKLANSKLNNSEGEEQGETEEESEGEEEEANTVE